MKKAISILFLITTMLFAQSVIAQDKVVVVPLSSNRAGGSDSQVQYNDNGRIAGANIYYEKSTGGLGIGMASPTGLLHIYDQLPGLWHNLSSTCRCPFGYSLKEGVSTQVICENDTTVCYSNSLIVREDGKVGIGQISEYHELNVEGEARVTDNLDLGYFLKITSSGGGGVILQDSTANLYIGAACDNCIAPASVNLQSTENILFRVGQIERMRIDSNGDVGIGTDAPQSALQVNGYVQLALTSGVPPAADCDETAERGRMIVDNADGNGKLYVCVDAGWRSATLGL